MTAVALLIAAWAAHPATCTTGTNACALQGRVKVVEHFADYKVRRVSAHEGLRVKWVQHFPNKPGLWQRVEHFPDFTIEFVDAHEDFTVREVKAFAGCR